MVKSGSCNVNGIGLATHTCVICLCQRLVVEAQYNDSPPTVSLTCASNSQLLMQVSNLRAKVSISMAHL